MCAAGASPESPTSTTELSERSIPRWPKGRVIKWASGVVGAFLVLGILIVLLVPTYLSSAGGRERILSALREKVEAPVEIDELQLSWFGSQRVESLRVGSPSGYPAGRDFLRVNHVTVETGLVGLLFGGGLLKLTIDEPKLYVHRDADGRFNFQALVGEENASKERKKEKESRSPRRERSEEGFSFPRDLVFKLRGGKLIYRDDKLQTDAELQSIESEVTITREISVVNFHAVAIKPDGSDAGQIELSGQADNPSGSIDLAKLRVEATGEAKKFDLRPYDGLLQELAQVHAPALPIDSRFTIKTESGLLRVEADLDAGFARLRQVAMAVPIEDVPIEDAADGGQRRGVSKAAAPMFLKIPYEADLAPTVALSLPATAALGANSLEGKLVGELTVEGPLSLEGFLSRGSQTLAGLHGGLLMNAKELFFGRRADPSKFSFAEDTAHLEARFSLGESIDSLNLQGAKLTLGKSTLDFAGTLGEPVGENRVRSIELRGDLDAGATEFLERFAASLQQKLNVTPETRLRFSDAVVVGTVGRGAEPLKALSVDTKLQLHGDVGYAGYSIKKLVTNVRWKAGELSLARSSAELEDGRLVSKELAYRPFDASPSYRGDFALSEMNVNYELAKVLAYAMPFLSLEDRKNAEFTGKLDAAVKLEGRGFALEDIQKSLKGNGSVTVVDATVRGSRFFGQLGTFLNSEFEELVITRMGSEFEIPGKGRIDASRVFLQTKSDDKVRDLGLKGSTWLDGRLEYGVDLEALKSSIGDKKIRQILGGVQKYIGSDSFPVKLRGTLVAPELTLEVVESSPLGRLFGGGGVNAAGKGAQATEGADGKAKKAGTPVVDPSTVEDLIKLFTDDEGDDNKEVDDAERKRRREERRKRRAEKRKRRKDRKNKKQTLPPETESEG